MTDLFEPIIVDNFFSEPDRVREYALRAVNYYPSTVHMTGGKWPGRRSYFLPWINNSLFNDCVNRLYDVLSLPADASVFFDITLNYCVATDPKGVVHKDFAWSQPDHVGVVYLTPEPADNSGSILYQPTEALLEMPRGPAYHDPANFDIKMQIENRYNRMVMYDPREFHNADTYFGDTLDNARLFIVFFMRINNMHDDGLQATVAKTATAAKKISVPWFDSPKRKDSCTCGSGKKFKACCGNMSLDREPPQDCLLLKRAVGTHDCEQLAASIAATEPASRDDCRWAVDTLIADMGQAGALVQRLEGTIATLCKKQIEPVLQWQIEWFEQPLLCTLPVGAHWQLHADAETYNAASGFAERQCNRDLTVLLFVDDMPADVTIHWPFFNYRYRTSRGDVLVFPSDQRFRYEMAASAQSACTVVLSWLNRVGPARTTSLPDGAYRLTDCD